MGANEAVIHELARSLRVLGRDSGYTGMADFDFRAVLEGPTASPVGQTEVQCWAIECNPRFIGAFWQMEELLKGDVLKSYFEQLFSGRVSGSTASQEISSSPWRSEASTAPSAGDSDAVSPGFQHGQSEPQQGGAKVVDPAYQNVLSRIEPFKWGADPAKHARDVGPWFFRNTVQNLFGSLDMGSSRLR